MADLAIYDDTGGSWYCLYPGCDYTASTRTSVLRHHSAKHSPRRPRRKARRRGTGSIHPFTTKSGETHYHARTAPNWPGEPASRTFKTRQGADRWLEQERIKRHERLRVTREEDGTWTVAGRGGRITGLPNYQAVQSVIPSLIVAGRDK